ncbi:MAG: family 16 glycosylhydrolase [Actinomycetes bacterium]
MENVRSRSGKREGFLAAVSVFALVSGALASGIGTSDAVTASTGPLVTSPADGSTVAGRVVLTSDGARTGSFVPSSVRFSIDGSSIGQASWNGTAYVLPWDSSRVPDGLHSINAVAKNRNRTYTGPAITVTVSQFAAPVTTTTTTTTTTVAPTTTTTTTPPSATATMTAQPPAAVTGGVAWDQMFGDDFSDPVRTAALWSTGMRNGAKTLEGNTELQWYDPANSVLTTDTDNGASISVLRQTAKRSTVAGRYYTVRTICRLYPPAQFPQYYNAAANNTCSDTNTTATLVPYQFTSGMLNNAKSFGYRYGYVEARVKMPKGFSMWPALWLRDWQPWSYEIDVMEGFDNAARTFRSTYWWGSGSHWSMENDAGGDVGLLTTGGTCHAYVPLKATTTKAGECSLANTIDLSAGYHRIGMNWTPTAYEFYLDGVKVWQSAPGASIDSAYNHLILNLAMGNSRWEFDWLTQSVRPFEANLADTTMFPKTSIEWDSVRVWQAPGAHDVCTTGSCPG